MSTPPTDDFQAAISASFEALGALLRTEGFDSEVTREAFASWARGYFEQGFRAARRAAVNTLAQQAQTLQLADEVSSAMPEWQQETMNQVIRSAKRLYAAVKLLDAARLIQEARSVSAAETKAQSAGPAVSASTYEEL